MKHSLLLLVATFACSLSILGGERPAVFSGDVAVRTELEGITVVVDTDRDGFPDHRFRLQMTQVPIDDPVEYFFEEAQVTHTKNALYVAATHEPVTLAFTLDKATVVPRDVTRRVAGFGLSYELAEVPPHDGNRRPSRVTGNPEQDVDPIDGGGMAAVNCPTGGRGSTSCESSCPGFSCSVTCSVGYYACCSCTRCKCYLN
jgi:hypothetical protein